MIIKGKIEAKKMTQEGTGAKGAWQRWVITIGGKEYSTFEKKIYNFFQVGDFVEMETKTDKSGKYENMVAMKKVDVEPSKEPSKALPTLKPIPQEFHQSIEACRYEALDIAIKYLTLRGEKAPMDLLLNMSGVILEYILGKINMMVEVKADVKANVV